MGLIQLHLILKVSLHIKIYYLSSLMKTLKNISFTVKMTLLLPLDKVFDQFLAAFGWVAFDLTNQNPRSDGGRVVKFEWF